MMVCLFNKTPATLREYKKCYAALFSDMYMYAALIWEDINDNNSLLERVLALKA